MMVQEGEAAAGDKALDADGDTNMDGGAAPEEAAATSIPEQPGASLGSNVASCCCNGTMLQFLGMRVD